MQPGLSPGSPGDPRPPTPETDYPESLTSYPEEDYSPVGSFVGEAGGPPREAILLQSRGLLCSMGAAPGPCPCPSKHP
ncbi:Rho GTPase activating protein 27 [Homo sapiens]|uniref:Rho GTPase activating protein 27 n=2 Tax=Hominidae TaxID=9604 RepID=E9PK18_HUMAN|nr:Rho GTPase activating protein 27 [Homo sapiens]KAI4050038.1 Rho GTPase activating protein 27 [Homo sapiens]PNJ50470.1 ARHGAP27 isoform 13 [Pongo abelii]